MWVMGQPLRWTLLVSMERQCTTVSKFSYILQQKVLVLCGWVLLLLSLLHLCPKDHYRFSPQLSIAKIVSLIKQKMSPCLHHGLCPLLPVQWMNILRIESSSTSFLQNEPRPFYVSFQWIPYKLSIHSILSYNMGYICPSVCPLYENPAHWIVLVYILQHVLCPFPGYSTVCRLLGLGGGMVGSNKIA
jgi:hypothetical protein